MNNDNHEEVTLGQVGQENTNHDDARRRFLKKSLYAAYATPVIMSLLVDKANAARSWGTGTGTPGVPLPPPPGALPK